MMATRKYRTLSDSYFDEMKKNKKYQWHSDNGIGEKLPEKYVFPLNDQNGKLINSTFVIHANSLRDMYLSDVEICIDRIVENIVEYIKNIDIIIGGQRFQQICGEQLDFFLHLTKKYVFYDYENKTTIIPLHVSVFMQMFPIPQYHDIQFIVSAKDNDSNVTMRSDLIYVLGSSKLFDDSRKKENCNSYFITDEGDDDVMEVLTVQNQFTGEDIMYGTEKAINLNFSNPVFLLYVSGIDPVKLKSIHLHFNGEEFFNTSDNKLKYTIVQGKIVILLSDKLDENIYNNTTINLSVINKAVLTVEVDGNEVIPLRVYALNYDIAALGMGMTGLRYSS